MLVKTSQNVIWSHVDYNVEQVLHSKESSVLQVLRITSWQQDLLFFVYKNNKIWKIQTLSNGCPSALVNNQSHVDGSDQESHSDWLHILASVKIGAPFTGDN